MGITSSSPPSTNMDGFIGLVKQVDLKQINTIFEYNAVNNKMYEFIGLQDKDSNYPCHIAASEGVSKVLQSLVNCSMRCLDNFGGNREAYTSLLLHARNNKVCTPLHLACAINSVDCVKILLDTATQLRSTIVNDVCYQGWSPLLLAASKGYTELVRLLIANGAEVNHKNADGHTACMAACFNGFVEVVQVLVDCACDTKTRSSQAETALFFACVKGHKEIANILLTNDKDMINARSFSGATPLHGACASGAAELVRVLISAGADVDAADLNHDTPFHVAAEQLNFEIMSILGETCNVNAANGYGCTVLHEAALHGRLSLVKFLLKIGVSLSIPDHDGLLPIHTAVRSSSASAKEIVRLIVERGSDVNATDSTGRTALHVAVSAKRENTAEIVELLLELGADVYKEDHQGWTPLHVAMSELFGEPSVADLLAAHIKKNTSAFFAIFSADKPRNSVGLDKPPSYSSLTTEQKQSVFGGEKPSLEGVAQLIQSGKCKKIVMLTGAGVSVNAGIPDFRNPKAGIYSAPFMYKYGLPSGSAVFDIGNFYNFPAAIYEVAKDVFFPAMLGDIKPTVAHKFIKLLYDKDLLLRNFTQNVDGLEKIVGIPPEKLVEVHGSFSEFMCVVCNTSFDFSVIKNILYNNEVPKCDKCNGLVRPGIVFFGDTLPRRFYEMYIEDLRSCDLLMVMGTSLKVYPFASLVNLVNDDVPRVLVNLDEVGPFAGVMDSKWNYRDVSAVGDCDKTVLKLCEMLSWSVAN